MKLIMEPKEVIKFQKVRFGVLLFLGSVWTATAIFLVGSHPREFLLRFFGLLALIFIIFYFIVFPFWGALDARRAIRARWNSTADVTIGASTFLAVIITVFIVYAVFPREVSLFSGSFAGYFIAFMMGAGNVFGGYKFTDKFLKWLGRNVFPGSRAASAQP